MSEPPKVPFLDISDEFAELESRWLERVREIGHSGRFILGPDVAALESEIAAAVGTGHAIGVASGTDALVLSLRALDIGPGDEVITSAYSFFASAEAITLVGARPVFVDIDLGTFNLDPTAVEAAITEHTKAIIPVHLYGNPAAMDELMHIARGRGLRVVEDCAQAFGARWGKRAVGGFGDTGCFSFYPTKVLAAYGDGGMITTNDEALAERLRRLRNHGASAPFEHAEIGYNSRLDEIQAALLRLKLPRIDRAIAARRAVAARYDEALQGLPVHRPLESVPGGHVYNLYTIRTPERDGLRAHLGDLGIASTVYYPVPLHRQPVYASLGYRSGDLPGAERAAREVLSLPIYPGMPDAHIARTCEAVATFFGE